MYLASCTRPDTSCAVGRFTRYTSKLDHVIGLHLINLKGMTSYSIIYTSFPTVLEHK